MELHEVYGSVLEVLLPVFLFLLGWGFKLLRSWALVQTSSKKFDHALKQLSEITEVVVRDLGERVVKQYKKDGSFDKDLQKHVKDLAVETIKTRLDPEILTYLEKIYGDPTSSIDTILGERVEAIVNFLKET